MPAVQVYTNDFRGGNLVPSLDANSWGSMKLGNSGPAANPTSTGQPQGLALSVTGGGSSPAAIGAYVVLGDGVLSLESRLLMTVEFDQPNAVPPPPPGTGRPEPWAIALNVKFRDENFVPNEPMVPVTCQFTSLQGVDVLRLNTPGNQEGDQAAALISPIDYSQLSPGRFVLEHHFCGVKAAGRYSIGYGSLSIGPPISKTDQRVYSNLGLSGGQQSWIGALGVTLVTLDGVGQIMVRLRGFSISTWS